MTDRDKLVEAGADALMNRTENALVTYEEMIGIVIDAVEPLIRADEASRWSAPSAAEVVATTRAVVAEQIAQAIESVIVVVRSDTPPGEAMAKQQENDAAIARGFKEANDE